MFTVAPDQERSAAGHSLTLHHPLRAKLVGPAALVGGRHADGLRQLGRAAPAEGRPAEAALLRDQPRPEPRRRRDLLGHGLGRLRGDADRDLLGRDLAGDRDGLHVRRGGGASRRAWRATCSSSRCRPGTLVNVNVPAGAPRGVRVVRQGKRRYGEAVIEKQDPRGRPYYWIGATPPTGDLEQGTDLVGGGREVHLDDAAPPRPDGLPLARRCSRTSRAGQPLADPDRRARRPSGRTSRARVVERVPAVRRDRAPASPRRTRAPRP